MHASPSLYRFRYRIHDVGVARATTKITAHSLTNLQLRKIANSEWRRNVGCGGTWPPRSCLFDHCDSRHDLSRRAETTLETIMIKERLLDWVKFSIALQSFDGRDLLTIMHRR
jgi:hypothetical protein